MLKLAEIVRFLNAGQGLTFDQFKKRQSHRSRHPHGRPRCVQGIIDNKGSTPVIEWLDREQKAVSERQFGQPFDLSGTTFVIHCFLSNAFEQLLRVLLCFGLEMIVGKAFPMPWKGGPC